MAQCLLTRTYRLRAMHTLRADARLEANTETGSELCERIHGHEYKIEITIKGPLDTKAGWILSRDKMDEIVHSQLIRPFDKSFLNDHFRWTSGEVLAQEFHEILKRSDLGPYLHQVALQETRKNRFLSLASEDTQTK